ncbi:hypothetical protein KNO15_16965 [Leifsonia shinshuensis]|uniref:hypothetical protein n=1 Tax=Leifsonia shinshuensis TaxID=150026 RepID=UPI001F510623|nr:hypothetical protein [Leifsonia shinshuensis]MCI0158395.1 hypothetical protein [Leifsonia shinshuensis]
MPQRVRFVGGGFDGFGFVGFGFVGVGLRPRVQLRALMMLDVGALGASTVSACCLLGSPRPRRVWISASLMVLAMLGCVLASAAPGLGLVSIVLSLASAGFALQRRDGRVAPMSLHRALGGVTMAALVSLSLGMAGAPDARGGGAVVPAHAHGVSLAAIAFAFVAGYLVYSAWLLAGMLRVARGASSPIRRVRPRSLLAVGEIAGMAVGVVLMCAM